MSPQPQVITVSGTSTRPITADQATLLFLAEGRGATIGEALRMHAEEVQRLVVEVERLHGGAEAFRAGPGDGEPLLPDATRERPRQGMAQEPSDLRPVPREQRRAEAVQVVEHVPSRDWT